MKAKFRDKNTHNAIIRSEHSETVIKSNYQNWLRRYNLKYRYLKRQLITKKLLVEFIVIAGNSKPWPTSGRVWWSGLRGGRTWESSMLGNLALGVAAAPRAPLSPWLHLWLGTYRTHPDPCLIYGVEAPGQDG